WGDMPDAQARGNLRHALSRIRKTLPAGARHGLILDGPTVALDPSVVDVDVAQFERLIADGQPPALEQIGGLYRGDLLAGLALTERPFEEWLTSERERLRARSSRPDRATVAGPAGGDPAPGPTADLLAAAVAALPEAPTPTNLPAPTSELIGRAAALAEVTELLGVHRLVTLIGAAGIGKTRLALEVARELGPSFADGVWVAELAPLSDPRLVPVTVAVALRLTLPAGAEPPERVASALAA